MPNADKKPKMRTPLARERSYTFMPWSCNHYPSFSEIEAYLPITGDFEIIADIHDTKGADAEVLANLITSAVNCYAKNAEMIDQMAYGLELCLTCAHCLSWEVEQEILALLKKYRQNAERAA